MSALPILMAASGGAADKLYVDDVFSTYLYTGIGFTQTINNGIDLAGKDGLVWAKSRSNNEHCLKDTVRGGQHQLKSNSTSASVNNGTGGITAFNSSGYSIGNLYDHNASGQDFVSWTFRKAPKFFDVVTYAGNGVAGRQIAHSLGVTPGIIFIKPTSTTGDWIVYHNSLSTNPTYGRYSLRLNTAEAQFLGGYTPTEPSASSFTVSHNNQVNMDGVQYVAYLFAHDPSADGIIQCGSFTGGSDQVINLGWEAQFVLAKRVDSTSDWFMTDVMRSGLLVDTGSNYLTANSSAVETSSINIRNSHQGFRSLLGTGTYIYLAIRRPNKPPTSGTQVYNAIARTGTGDAATVTGVGFAPDFAHVRSRSGSGYTGKFVDRLRGATKELRTQETVSELTATGGITSLFNDGVTLGGDGEYNASGPTFINHFFRRAPGSFDVVCDTGTGVAHAIAHNLTKAPELIIRKSRSAATQWEVWHSALAATEKLVLNSNAAKATDATAWGSTLPTATQFTVGTGANVNANAATFVTYLFATLAGISKVGSYTGNGSSQTINCGFSAGARFILIKRTDSTGDWYVWDTARGIVAANDPHLSLNTTAAEVTTDDSVDPHASGFIVNQNAATNINVSGASYLFLAIA